MNIQLEATAEAASGGYSKCSRFWYCGARDEVIIQKVELNGVILGAAKWH